MKDFLFFAYKVTILNSQKIIYRYFFLTDGLPDIILFMYTVKMASLYYTVKMAPPFVYCKDGASPFVHCKDGASPFVYCKDGASPFVYCKDGLSFCIL